MTTRAAPRIGTELRAVIKLADDGASAAEICRRVGAAAERLGLVRPSYEQVRVLLRAQREGAEANVAELPWRDSRVPGSEVLLDVIWQARPATDFYLWLTGERLPDRFGATNEPRK